MRNKRFESPNVLPWLTGLLVLVTATAAGGSTGDRAQAVEQVERASAAWIEAFNRGDADACAELYTADAFMEARPLAELQGREAIRDFWREVLTGDPGTLQYQDPQIHLLDERTAVLSSRWTMSRLGSGLITLERWELQDDGEWRLVEDRFEIVEQHAAAAEVP